MFIFLPAVLFAAVTITAKIQSEISARTIAASFVVLLLPTMAAAHLIKAMLKMTPRLPYWSYTLSDPTGIETARKILDKNIVLNQSIPDALYGTISFASLSLLAVALTATLLIFRKSPAVNKFDANVKVPLFLGVLIYWSIFALTIFKWRF